MKRRPSVLLSACILKLCPSQALVNPRMHVREPPPTALTTAMIVENDFLALSLDRRQLLLSMVMFPFLPRKANARGLVQFPIDNPKDMLNTYDFLRVGDTLLEDEDIWSTNPLFLTNREAALSPRGQGQIQEACAQMEKANRSPGIIKYSLAASCIDSANIVGDTLDLGRERIIPEFTFLDPRGIGKWEMLSKSQTTPAVWALDALEAGPNGTGGRPPANEDGTPNETLADQAVRLRQVMSILETLYSGESILIIFPDSTGPALLSAMIAGVPLNRVHEFEFKPGELRMDVTKASILQFLQEKPEGDSQAYENTLAVGREELARLRATKEIVSLKDQRLEAERIEIDNQYNEKEARRLDKEEALRESREERAREIREKQLQLREERQQASLERQPPKPTQATLEVGDSTSPLLAVGAAAVVGTAGIFASAGSNSVEEKLSAKEDPVGPKNITSGSPKTMDTAQEGTLIQDAEPAVESVDLLADLILEEPSPEPTIDRFELAEKAMKEYLDKDDGGEDWLAVMSEIIDDDSEEMPGDDMNKQTAK